MKGSAKSSGVPHEEEPPSKIAKKEIEEHPSKVPRRGEPTSPTSPMRSALASTPHFAGGIQTVRLNGEEKVEVDEFPLEHPDDGVTLRRMTPRRRQKMLGHHIFLQRSWQNLKEMPMRPS